jgi:pimeloyl-ACP methyl ester carboxylesterase
MWAPQVEALEDAGHRVVAPDLPGYGDAALRPGTVDYAAEAAALLERPAAVVGASFGGRVALALAVSRPELVERLALVAAALGGWEWSEAAGAGLEEEEALLEAGDLRGAAEQQARMWLAPAAPVDVRELTVAMTLRSYEQQLPLEDQVRTVWPEPPAEARLGEIGVPALVVVGSEDLDDMHAMSGRIAAELPDARLVTIEGAGHLPSLERPEELNKLLLGFLQDGV